mmetsp:Transcript_72641/g.210274  ORF Transcript_72641/g.210274 Transcript_72641/m.210274 type:complete len:213 (+) Transcript_72641:316-954(+)
MSADLRFHSVTKPFTSTPKIGAFALSINRERSSAMRICSLVISRICVMSWPTPITPVISPSGPLRVVAFRRMSRRSPLFVNKGNSKLAVSVPNKAELSTWLTDSRNSCVMKPDTRFLPMASILLYPSKLDALAFHSETLPCTSMPKIGAFAVSMRRVRSSAMRWARSEAVLISVMSCPTPTTPIMSPFASLRAVAFSRMSRCSPAFVKRGSS